MRHVRRHERVQLSSRTDSQFFLASLPTFSTMPGAFRCVMPSPEPKQQHYIPETYSKRFSDEKGLVTVYDMRENCRIFRTTPKNVFKENYLYSQPVHAESRFDNAIERLFSDGIENNWTDVAESIAQKRPLSKLQVEQFFEFFLSMRCRVPNALQSVVRLLRQSVTKYSAEISEPVPEMLAKIYREKLQGLSPDLISMEDIINAGMVKVDVDPHTAILSMPYIVQGMLPVMGRVNAPSFLHNKTDIDFISSDNPVCYFRAGSKIDDIVPYDVKYTDEFELIFPITPRIAFYIDSRRPQTDLHTNTANETTVTRINEVISLFAERYIFSSGDDNIALAKSYSNRCPVPNFEKSIVGDGLVRHVGYEIGEPSALNNAWEYPFRR